MNGKKNFLKIAYDQEPKNCLNLSLHSVLKNSYRDSQEIFVCCKILKEPIEIKDLFHLVL